MNWVRDAIIIRTSQFHDYLLWVNVCLAQCLHNVLNVKALVGFQPGEGPSRGLRRDCEIFGNLCIAFVSSSNRHEGRDVDCEHVVGQLALELHVNREAGVHPGGSLHVALNKSVRKSIHKDTMMGLGHKTFTVSP